jgi:protoporphyrinogen oxidase
LPVFADLEKKAIIIGAGPAGLTAAYELLQRTAVIPLIIEQSGDIGGLSKTVNYKGNRMDIGGHRFFSKSDRVMQWWLNIMPMEVTGASDVTVYYRNQSRKIASDPGKVPANPDLVMLLRRRISRIYFLHKFFGYPIQLSLDTLRKLGLSATTGILVSYMNARLFPRKPEKSLEDFFINRFGARLYRLFFKDYTEKVWGVPCTQISAEWGAQRIKGVSVNKAIRHALRSLRKTTEPGAGQSADVFQKDTETSLIERFLYPKWGPGQLWEEAARLIREKGGQILMRSEVQNIETDGNRIVAVEAINTGSGEISRIEGDYFFSTMSIQQFVAGMGCTIPAAVKEVAAGLQYRDFITVGILLRRLAVSDIRDTWIYIQDRDVQVGRLQIFNNWSPSMVSDPDTIWIGMEYFCNKGEAFWDQTDENIKETGMAELEKMNLARREDFLDSTVLRVEKTYPAYFGTYERFDEIREYLNRFPNLFLIGRNGMHKYNNSDHSMLTAMVAVDNIAAGITDKSNIWSINTEQEYHEEK